MLVTLGRTTALRIEDTFGRKRDFQAVSVQPFKKVPIKHTFSESCESHWYISSKTNSWIMLSFFSPAWNRCRTISASRKCIPYRVFPHWLLNGCVETVRKSGFLLFLLLKVSSILNPHMAKWLDQTRGNGKMLGAHSKKSYGHFAPPKWGWGIFTAYPQKLTLLDMQGLLDPKDSVLY